MATANGEAGDDATFIFTYGTLKRGFHNHALMEDLIRTRDAFFLGHYSTVESFPLVVGPHGIPYLINLPESGHRVLGELYSVSSGRGVARLDELERVEDGHYERLPVEVKAEDGGEKAAVVKVLAYFAHREFGEAMWNRCKKEGLREYSMELGKKYVIRQNRPLNSSFHGDIQNFISRDN